MDTPQTHGRDLQGSKPNQQTVSQNFESIAEDTGSASSALGFGNTLPRRVRRVLHLFSDESLNGSLAFWLSKLGFACDVKGRSDLLDDQQWRQIFSAVAEESYGAVFAAPPWDTFVKTAEDMSPLRGLYGPDRYGFAGLSAESKLKLRQHNYWAIMSQKLAELCHDHDVLFSIANPARTIDEPSLFALDEYLQLQSREGVRFVRFPLCMFGSKFQGYTEILGTIDLDAWAGECACPSQQWVIPWSGERFLAPHPSLLGKQIAIPVFEWRPFMLNKHEPGEQLLVEKYSQYPAFMHRQLALSVAANVTSSTSRARINEPARFPFPVKRAHVDDISGLPKVTKVARLTGRETACQDRAKEQPVVGGLRSPREAVRHSSELRKVGVIVRNLIDRKLTPEVESCFLASIGAPLGTANIPKSWVDSLRVEIAQHLTRTMGLELQIGAWEDFNLSVDNHDCQTQLKHAFVKLWAKAAEDPALKIVDWLEQGAPAGVTLQPDLDGIFPEAEHDQELLDFEVLHTDFDSFQNYLGVEDSPAAKDALQGYIDKGYLVPYGTLEECAVALGSPPILSKLGCISKTKLNPDGTQTVKHRIILDARRSNVTSATQRRYRSVLPRLTDAVQDALVFASELQPGQVMEQMIADISDAFWQIPLHPNERKFFVAKFQGRFLSFVRTAQGSRAAPLTFCAVMAMLTRFAQALFFRDAGCRNHPEEARLQVYTDDPWLIARGSQSQINRTFAVLMIAWELFGLPVATHKAVRGVCLKWIGMKLEVSPREVKVHVPEDKVLELETLSLQILSGNVVSCKLLRSYAGKAMNIATVIHTWRPFVQQLFAALNTEGLSGAPKHCVWTKQIQTPMYWILAFLHQLRSHLVRRWDVAAFANKGEHVAIMWDASPFGLGAVLILNGVIKEYLHDISQPFETDLLDISIGSSESQQTMEALAGLVALRIWKQHWMSARAFLALRSDNMGALTLFGRLKTSSRANSIIAREFALDLGDSSFAPQVTEHIPGFSNIICDNLSRLQDPSKQYSIPGCLSGIPRVPCPSRDRAWWRSLCPPQLVRSAHGH